MNYHKAYCQNCKRNVFVDKSKISKEKASFRVRCTHCSNIFTYNIDNNDSIVNGIGKKDYYIEKGKAQINNFSKSENLKGFLGFAGKLLATFSVSLVVFFVFYYLGFENKAGGFAALSGFLFFLAIKDIDKNL